MSLLAERVEALVPSRELLGSLTMRELRGKYKGSVLGWGWSLLNPLATMAVFTVVFHFVLRIPPPPGADGLRSYPLFLLCGLLPWNFLSAVLGGGMASLVGNGNLIKKTYFPRQLLVGAVVTSTAVTFGIEMAVLVVVLVLAGNIPLLWIPSALLFMVALAVFALGLALALSVANVYFRDTTYLVGILLQLWFYATPIIYPIQQLTASPRAADLAARYHLVTLYRLNPMTDIVEGIREALYSHTMLAWPWTLYAVGSAAVVGWGGWRAFARLEGRLAEEL